MDKILDYWEKMSDWVLPFLEGRKIAIEQMFGDFSMYHRHPTEDKEEWIYIKSRQEILDWADKHAWSFHPHIQGDKNWWFVVDVDSRGKGFDLDLTKRVAVVLAEVFEELSFKYLVKYSGSRGFHFMWEWDMTGKKLKKDEQWDKAQEMIENLRKILEGKLLIDKDLTEKLRKLAKKDCSLVVTNSQDKNCKHSILLDANILHENANIRSPFSVHLGTGLVSVPLKGIDGLKKFKKLDAKRAEVMKQDWSWVELPKNKWRPI